MAVEKVGNLFRHLDEYDTICIPCNGVIKSDLSLVMGAGVARTCTRLDLPPLGSHLPSQLGVSIIRAPWVTHNADSTVYHYGFVLSEYDSRVGAFQSKRHHQEESDLALIKFSMHMMLDKLGQERRVALFYPGIGLGNLEREAVWSVMFSLPNNYHLWRKEP